MENGIMTYSYGNIEAMINAITANSEIINNMIKRTKKNDKEINCRLSDYAKTKKNVNNNQIEMYRYYIEKRSSIEESLDEYKARIENNNILYKLSSELTTINNDYSVLHRLFDEINKFQVKIMEMLCGLLGQANSLLSCL